MNRNYFIGEPAGNKEFIISLHWQSALAVKYENAFLMHPGTSYYCVLRYNQLINQLFDAFFSEFSYTALYNILAFSSDRDSLFSI
jgi:hypothetical protein